MNKKILLGIIIALTLLVISLIIIFGIKDKYNKLVINNTKWENIISKRKQSNDIEIEEIRFNDYNLLIDNDNIIYYSIVDTSDKYNPLIDYITNDTNLKLVINNKMKDDYINNDSSIQIMIYNDKYYRIYNLIITDLPIINIESKDGGNSTITIFDNHTNIPQKLTTSEGKLMEINEEEYSLSLIKESLGRNKRKNRISILGMDKHHEFIIKKVDTKSETKKNIQLFINNKYMGIYTIEEKM